MSTSRDTPTGSKSGITTSPVTTEHKNAPAVPEGNVSQDLNAAPPGDLGFNVAHPSVPTDPSSLHENIKEVSIIDPFFRENFIIMSTLTWPVTAQPGQVLFSAPITPAVSHENLEYVFRMYNGWVGSMEYQLLLAGTGFMGGKLIIAKLPPNAPVKNSYTISELMYFKSKILDPKSMEPTTAPGDDVRNILFHYTTTFSSTPVSSPSSTKTLTRDDIGGRIVVAVMLPLVTSNQDTNAMYGQVNCRAGPDLEFGMMVPLSFSEAPIAPNFDLFGQFSSAPTTDPWIAGRPLSIMKVANTPIIASNARCLVGIDGAPHSPNLVNLKSQYSVLSTVEALASGGGQQFITTYSNTQDDRQDLGFKATLEEFDYINKAAPATPAVTVKSWLFNDGAGIPLNTYCVTPNAVVTDASGEFYLPTLDTDVVWDKLLIEPLFTTPEITNPLGELIIYFMHDSTQNSGTFTTYVDKELLRTGYMSSEYQTPVFQVMDSVSELPLGLVRLNREGYFSTRMPAGTVFELEKVRLSYQYSLETTAPLPPPTAAQGMMLAAQSMMRNASSAMSKLVL